LAEGGTIAADAPTTGVAEKTIVARNGIAIALRAGQPISVLTKEQGALRPPAPLADGARFQRSPASCVAAGVTYEKPVSAGSSYSSPE
jgi:hypothetical protein